MRDVKAPECPRTHLTWKATLLTVVLLALAFGAGATWMRQTPSQPSTPLIDPARAFVSREHFIINIQPLRTWLTEYVEKASPARVSLYFEVLNTGSNISINKELQLFPASLMKIPVAMVVMRKVQDGSLRLDEVITLRQQHLNTDSGKLHLRGVGARLTVRELLTALLHDSDNTAYYALLERATPADLNSIIEEVGLWGLFDATTGAISAKEYSRFFRALYTSSYLEPEHSQFVLDLLSKSAFKDFLTSGLPQGVPFAHKFGEHIDQGVYLDSGIVYLPSRPYLLTVMIQEAGDVAIARADASRIMKEISAQVHDYISKYKK